MARQAIVRDRLPRRRVGDELPEAGTDAWITVDRAEPDTGLRVILGITGEDGRTTLTAEPLLVAVGRSPRLQRRLALGDSERSRHDRCIGRRRCTCAPLATSAMAVPRPEQRLGDLETHRPAVTAAGESEVAHADIR